MRMRHKKNLESRLDAVSEYLITLRNESLNFNDVKNEKHTLDFYELFGNDFLHNFSVFSGNVN